ncbi:glycosyltransferase, group 1 family [Treponema primitia ZAS-2]|uniref:Glycosyltransferase, group 1 family n=1 Tax=Treponema primitia (strain ATCC BAA-887 / DSM 12427 / ZAS-2) TaxID=545694 RepID=F5YNZ4_TREPZ|nr:glycosyltransferase family 4 protein [Treponema primitia]AEF86455.1 glycosyltransferase, group 1 family [Treponema primitia ZAS-2]
MNNILFITAFPPNNKSGGQTFSMNLLRDLATKYSIDLVYFSYKNHTIDPTLQLNLAKIFTVKNANSLICPIIHPIFTRRFNRTILNYLKGIIKNYDIVFFDHIQVGLYAVYLNHPYKIIRCHDILAQKYTRSGIIVKQWISITEKKILKMVHKIFVPSEKDVNFVKKVYGIDVLFTHEYLKKYSYSTTKKMDNIFIFFGVWSRKENVKGLIWFIKNVYPRINCSSDIRFIIIGGELASKLQKRYVLPYHNIEYIGFVENPLDILHTSSALVAPLFAGAGVKVKVIDAFTTGTPVIGTDITFEGLPFIEKLVYHADDPQEYADIINNFCSMSFNEKQQNAQKFCMQYNNHHLVEQL